MTIEELKKNNPLMSSAGVQYAGVFGSVARGEAGPQSDVIFWLNLFHQLLLPLTLNLAMIYVLN